MMYTLQRTFSLMDFSDQTDIILALREDEAEFSKKRNLQPSLPSSPRSLSLSHYYTVFLSCFTLSPLLSLFLSHSFSFLSHSRSACFSLILSFLNNLSLSPPFLLSLFLSASPSHSCSFSRILNFSLSLSLSRFLSASLSHAFPLSFTMSSFVSSCFPLFHTPSHSFYLFLTLFLSASLSPSLLPSLSLFLPTSHSHSSSILSFLHTLSLFLPASHSPTFSLFLTPTLLLSHCFSLSLFLPASHSCTLPSCF